MSKQDKKIVKAPREITLCNLEVIVMPNGEVLSRGKSLGWIKDFKKGLTAKQP